MRALFYLLDGDTNASSYHRALQFFPALRRQGIHPFASRPVPPALYARLVEQAGGRPRRRGFYYGLFLARRLADVLAAGRFDVVVIQRDLFPFGPPLLERLLRRLNPRLVYDTDDATYLRPVFTPTTPFQRLRRFDKVAEVVRHARWVSVASEPIAAWARACNPRVSVVPMAVDLAPYDAARASRARSAGGPLVVGWTGTRAGLRYLEALAPVLRDLACHYPVQLRAVSGAHRELRLPGVAVDARPWRLGGLDDLAAFDVGLVPLDDTPFERAKFPFKLLQYLALGVPAVCARVGAAAELARESEGALLAGSPDEWREQLARLLSDRALRGRLAAAGRAAVEAGYTLERVAPLLGDGLRRAAG